jgi:hypothetical protein
METYKQSDINFVNNLANIIFENELKIITEFYHSPQMYTVLLEDKKAKRPTRDVFLSSLFEFLLTNQEFIGENYKILSKQELSEQEKNRVVNYINENWKGDLGRWLAKQILRAADSSLGKKLIKWWDGPAIPSKNLWNIAERKPGHNGTWDWHRGPFDTRPIWPNFPGNELPPNSYPFGLNSGGSIPTRGLPHDPFGGPGE